MHVAVVTIFPDMLTDAFRAGVVGQAQAREQWRLSTVNPRDFATDVRRTVDDRPFGGGPGMVMMYEPLVAAIAHAKAQIMGDLSSENAVSAPQVPRILLTPRGVPFNQAQAKRLSALSGFVLVCGRYEGIDERVEHDAIDEAISLGDYVLSGGEIAAMAIIDAAARLLPGVLGHEESAVQESFTAPSLDYPTYTRPEILPNGRAVPQVLMSGNHAKIAQWRREQALALTRALRPDLESAQ